MIAHDRTRYRGHQANLPGCIRQRSQDRPRERRMPLLRKPRKEVVGNRREIETGLFGPLGIADQIGRAVFFGHQLVAELDHGYGPACS